MKAFVFFYKVGNGEGWWEEVKGVALLKDQRPFENDIVGKMEAELVERTASSQVMGLITALGREFSICSLRLGIIRPAVKLSHALKSIFS